MYGSIFLNGRSVHRRSATTIPRIKTQWVSDSKVSSLTHTSLEVGSIFTNYDRAYLEERQLPPHLIPPRLATGAPVASALLKELLEEVVAELLKSKTVKSEYTHFIVVKKRDYNPRTHAGLIILRFKHYPFVAKIFMENPQSFVCPFSKGFEPIVFFMMSGGGTRFLSGFSRLKNREVIKSHLLQSDLWRHTVDLPRKWFWQPEQQRWFHVFTENLGTKTHSIVLPSVYAIICDAINSSNHFKILNEDNRKQALALCHYLGIRVDPHIKNFMLESETGLLVLVDSEHFPTMVGLRQPFIFENYRSWYAQLCYKGLCDCFMRPKYLRKALQESDTRTILPC